MKLRRLLNLRTIAKFAFILAPWAFIAYLLRDVDAVLDAFRDASAGLMVGALLLILFALATMAFLWARLVAHLSRETAEPDAPHLMRAFARSWLARYLPGKVWIYGARVIHTDSDVVPSRIVARSLADEFALVVGSTTALGLGFWTWALAGAVAGLPVLLIGLMLVVVVVFRLDQVSQWALRLLGRVLPQRWRSAGEDLRRAADDPGLGLKASALFAGSYLLSNLAGGLAFVLVVVSLGEIGWGDVPLLVGAYSLAAVIGLAAFFAPAGIGVREAVLVAFITPVVASPVAASVVVLVRVLMIIADVLFVGLVEASTAFSGRTATEAVARMSRANHKSTPHGPGR